MLTADTGGQFFLNYKKKKLLQLRDLETLVFLQGAALQQFLPFISQVLCCKVKRNGRGRWGVFLKRELPPELTVSQVEVVGSAGRPQPHGVHRVVHVAGDGCVVRHRQHHLQAVQRVSSEKAEGEEFSGGERRNELTAE